MKAIRRAYCQTNLIHFMTLFCLIYLKPSILCDYTLISGQFMGLPFALPHAVVPFTRNPQCTRRRWGLFRNGWKITFIGGRCKFSTKARLGRWSQTVARHGLCTRSAQS